MPPKRLHLRGDFGVYLQVPDLDRSLAFYRDVLGLEITWNDGALAVLRSHGATSDTVVLRAIGEDSRHELGESGVTRVFWRVGEQADLDAAEKLLERHEVQHQRHRDPDVDGITLRDPDGLHIVLLYVGEGPPTAPPAWLYWYR